MSQSDSARPMEIEVVWGTGSGTAELGAFDAALAEANLHNCNLVRLSSIIPPGTKVVQSGAVSRSFQVGDIVAVVLSAGTVTPPAETVVAGLGWATAEEGGVFMEAVATSPDSCREEIRRGLADARSTREEWNWHGEDHHRIAQQSGAAGDSAFVAAVYGSLDLS